MHDAAALVLEEGISLCQNREPLEEMLVSVLQGLVNAAIQSERWVQVITRQGSCYLDAMSFIIHNRGFISCSV